MPVVEFQHAGRTVAFDVDNPLDVIQREHARGVFYELEELAIIARHFRPGQVFLDVGANVGNHAVFVGLFLEPRQVVVIEPLPAARAILQRNIALNGLEGVVDTSLLGVGFSDAASAAEVRRTDPNNLGATRLRAAPEGAPLHLDTGDALLGDRRVDFIKLDVEGMELPALMGLRAVITRCRPAMFIEVDEPNAGAFQAFLDAAGYGVVETFKRYRSNFNAMVLPHERANAAAPPP